MVTKSRIQTIHFHWLMQASFQVLKSKLHSLLLLPPSAQILQPHLLKSPAWFGSEWAGTFFFSFLSSARPPKTSRVLDLENFTVFIFSERKTPSDNEPKKSKQWVKRNPNRTAPELRYLKRGEATCGLQP